MPIRDWNDPAVWEEMYQTSAEPWGTPSTRAGGKIRMAYCRCVLAWQYETMAMRTAPVLFGPPPGPSVVTVGAGFGWYAEHYESMGYDRIQCCDDSSYIQTRKDDDGIADVRAAIERVGLDPDAGDGFICRERIRGAMLPDQDFWRRSDRGRPIVVPEGNQCQCSRGVLDEDCLSPGSQQRVTQALFGPGPPTQPDIVLTEDIMSTLTDAEALALHNALLGWGVRLIHHITTRTVLLDWRPVETQKPANPSFNWKTGAEWKALLPGAELWDYQARTLS